jgi:hypothetical protein
MPDEPLLRQHARAAMRAGKIPRHEAVRTWGGPGAGETCVICDRAIPSAELEIEIQFDGAEPKPEPDNLHVHVRCFAAWEFERRKPDA